MQQHNCRLSSRPAPLAGRSDALPAGLGEAVAGAPSAQWNVLAEELVAYPPCPAGGLRPQRSWRTAGAALQAARSAAGGGSGPLPDDPPERRSRPADGPRRPRPTRVRPDRRASRAGHRLTACGTPPTGPSRRDREGCGASSPAPPPSPRSGPSGSAPGHCRRPTSRGLIVIPGSVPSHGGYLYVVRPGDTLWAIASRVQPGGDPRPLVDRLQAQLHGAAPRPGRPDHPPLAGRPAPLPAGHYRRCGAVPVVRGYRRSCRRLARGRAGVGHPAAAGVCRLLASVHDLRTGDRGRRRREALRAA